MAAIAAAAMALLSRVFPAAVRPTRPLPRAVVCSAMASASVGGQPGSSSRIASATWVRRDHIATRAPQVCGTRARKPRTRQSDAGLALTAGRDSNVSSTTALGHTYAGQRKVEMHTWQ